MDPDTASSNKKTNEGIIAPSELLSSDVVRISLHRDLLTPSRSQDLLPDMILEEERKKNSQAVVLYKAPSKVIKEILAKSEDYEMAEESEEADVKGMLSSWHYFVINYFRIGTIAQWHGSNKFASRSFDP